MVVANNTKMKTMEANIKKLFQLVETNAEEHRADIAQLTESSDLRMEAIQQSLTQVLRNQQQDTSPDSSFQLPHGSNS